MNSRILRRLGWNGPDIAQSATSRTLSRINATLRDGARNFHPAQFWALALAERDRWPLFVPVIFSCGIALYFSLTGEPSWPATILISAFALAALLVRQWVAPRNSHSAIASSQVVIVVLSAVNIASAGFLAAKSRTEQVAAPILEREIGPVDIRGTIEAAARQESGGWQIVLLPMSIEGVAREKLPVRMRISVRQKDMAFAIGQQVDFWAHIGPPPEPVSPRAFDFARQLYFRQIGAVGFALGTPRIRSVAEHDSLLDSWNSWLAQSRLRLADRIRDQLTGEAGAVAAALLTGDRDMISEQTKESLRIAGLAHLLAISGLHMALFGGLVYSVTRLILAAVEPLALRYPVKKWAAIVGWFAALIYLLLTGANLSTQRAFIMISVMFFAILIDRAAFSMRSVVVAAMIILVMKPESLLDVGFQMSFAAVIALIAVYEVVRRKRLDPKITEADRGPASHLLRKFSFYFLGIAATSIVAGFATGPFAAFHFNRVAAYGLIGDLLVMPVVGLIIMPAAVLGLVLMPFGWEGPAIAAMGQGIDWLLFVADSVTALEGSEFHTPSWPTSALALFCLGGVWMSFWQRSWRLWGLVLAGIAVGQAVSYQLPDIIIDRDGKNMGLRNEDGRLIVMSDRRARFAADVWARRNGQGKPAIGRDARPFNCDPQGCAVADPSFPAIVFVHDPAVAEEECQRAEILISDRPLPRRLRRRCKERILAIDRFDLWRYGAHAIWLKDDGFRVERAQDNRGRRPWSMPR